MSEDDDQQRQRHHPMLRKRIQMVLRRPFSSSATAAAVTLWLISTTAGFRCNYVSQQHNSVCAFWISTSRPTKTRIIVQQNAAIFLGHRAKVPTTTTTRLLLAAASTPNLDSNDPFQILGIDPSSPEAVDKKTIKRAYKRLALKYHPDVIAGGVKADKDEKKVASDRFAKINWAYETLIGKNSNNSPNQAYAGSTASSTSSSANTGGWTPPHRRKTGTTSSTTGSGRSYTSSPSTDWRDYMPKYEEEDAKYDAAGDSFGAIFSDLFSGGASSSSGGTVGLGMGAARFVTDFVEFLEGSSAFGGAGGFGGGTSGSSSDENDAQLRILLQTGSVKEIGEEMDDTELVLQQLKSKNRNLEDELLQVNADLKFNSVKYMERVDFEERAEEINARKKVVDGYIKKAQKRLLALQTRYKELIVNGENDWGAAASGSGTSTTKRSGSSGYDSPSYSTSPSSSSSPSSTSSSTSYGRPQHEKEDAWKDESFGSFGRGRGSSRRRQQQQQRQQQEEQQQSRPSSTSQTTSAGPPSSTSSSSSYYNRSSDPRTTASNGSSTTGNTSSSTSDRNVPPHRRTPGSSSSTVDDQRRLRELKVDEEFEKLRKELGL